MSNLKTYKFEKDELNKWYIVLPEWTGDKSELEMVCGADTMLDILAQSEVVVYMTFSDTEFLEHTFTLDYITDESGGAMYALNHELYNFEVWLCHVTKFVFGYLPSTIYCK